MNPTKQQLLEENRQLRAELEGLKNEKIFDRLDQIINSTSDFIFTLNLAGEFRFMNAVCRHTLGFSHEERSGLNIRDILHPDFVQETLAELDQTLDGQAIDDFETVFINKDNVSVFLRGSINLRLNRRGEVTGFICILHDFTKRMRAEKSQKLYYNITQRTLNSPDMYTFLSDVHEELKTSIQANNFFVALYDPKKSYVHFPYYVDDYFKSNLRFTKRKLGNGLVEYCILANKPLLMYEDDIQALADEKKIYLYGLVPKVLLSVPLRVGNRNTGIIGVQSYSNRNKFSETDLEVLEFISGQVAIALSQKQTESDLNQQTARLRAIFDSSSHLIWTVNRRFQLSSFNKNYADLIESQLKIPPQINISTEKLGWRLIAPDDRKILQEKYNVAFRGSPQYFEMHWGEVDGGDNWFEFYLNPILHSESGQIEEVAGIARDVTEKKKATLALQQSEGKFRNIVESFLDIYYRTNLAGQITMISPSVLEQTGYSLDEVIGQKVDKFFVNASDSSKNIKGLLKSGSISNYEVNVRKKDGTLRQFMLNIRLIKSKDGLPFEIEGVARDITELVKSAEELVKAKEEAEHSLKVKERFLANMSHEIRTPMNGIIGMIDLINETPLNTEQQDYIQTIKKSSETLLTILNDILDLSKIEAGKMELHESPIVLKELLEGLVSLFRQRAIEKNNLLTYVIDEDVPPYLIADQTRLLQIFSNLTSNALKFTEDGKVNIRIKKVSEQGKKLVLRGEVSDTGIGISEKNQTLLFSAFQQLDNSTKKSFGGTGLGLAISRQLCKMMKGGMGVISEEGQGSTFWVEMQVRSTSISPTSTQTTQAETPLTGVFVAYQPKILLVDDNQVNRKVASEILKKSGCFVKTADSGRKAIEIYEQEPDFDVILMDIQMPEMDGIETTQALRERFHNLPTIVAMTAYSMQHDRERFLAAGMDDYVSKPIRAAVLIDTIKRLSSNRNVSSSPIINSVTTPHQPESRATFDMEIVGQLKEMVGEEMVLSVFEDFEVEAREQILNTKRAYPDDVKSIQRELHTLKGNSGTIGLSLLHDLTAAIEVPAKIGDLTDFETKIQDLEAEFEAFVRTYRDVAAVKN